ncbi:MAG: bis(5'-nucleosyl)-tetraphosphatase (symmetrical) YqeK [Brevinematia bacterium]
MNEDIVNYIKEHLSKERFLHSLGVREISRVFAKRYSLSPDRLEVAALLHDVGKEMPEESQIDFLKESNIFLTDSDLECKGILHAFAGAIIARDRFKIEDKEILNAIRYHPTGHPDFGLFEKVIFASDYLDPSRRLKGQKRILKIAMNDIDRGIIEIIREKLNYVISNGEFLHHLTIEFYNKLLRKS